MIYIGIDPGKTGAVAIIGDSMVPMFFDTPLIQVKENKHDYDTWSMASVFSPYRGRTDVAVIVESVHSMPEQGVASSFDFGRGLGLWEGILAALCIRYEKISPQRWKKTLMDGMSKEKDASRIQAMRLFPSVAGNLALKKHHGRADALLMAEFGRRTIKELI